MVAAFSVLLVAYLARAVPWRIAVMAVAPLAQLAVTSSMVKRGITTTDCVALTWLGAGVLMSYHVWERLGLPGAA